MNKKDRAWERYRKIVDDVSIMGTKEWSDAVTAGPAGFMESDTPGCIWETDPELHEKRWRNFLCIPEESKYNTELSGIDWDERGPPEPIPPPGVPAGTYQKAPDNRLFFCLMTLVFSIAVVIYIIVVIQAGLV